MYAGAPLALGAFRKRIPDVERPYRLPAAFILSPLAFIVANLIILWTGWETDWKLGLCIILGYIIIVLNRVLKLNSTPVHFNWKSAQWLFPYLIGMGLIIYLSDWNPSGPNLFPFGIDILVTAVFSLVIYYWAVNTSVPKDGILEMAEETAAIAESSEMPLA